MLDTECLNRAVSIPAVGGVSRALAPRKHCRLNFSKANRSKSSFAGTRDLHFVLKLQESAMTSLHRAKASDEAVAVAEWLKGTVDFKGGH